MSAAVIAGWNPSISELTFSKAFLVLLKNSSVGVSADTTSLAGAPSPTLLSKMPKLRSSITQPPSSSSLPVSVDGAVTITVKSLRAPHKFTATVTAAPTDSLFRVKEQLLADPAVAATAVDARVCAADVRLLKRGKVVSDAHSVGEVSEGLGEVSLVAVLPAEGTAELKEKEEEQEEQVKGEEEKGEDIKENEKVGTGDDDNLPETVWEAVASVVASRVGAGKAGEVVARLKRGWVLAGGEPIHEDLD
ncbi:uncharacterized protein SAPINGB_P003748 [Magnusiomyces paraingens]|uniref:Ubiquitin-like domain-containing protein n=1 Tax=Magnusiomyces paraingens TaxID=2606893 RepID=A0A5E8BYE4_9ASCO|nr:uncharacterized protein SAPINGB_P003748 [Saprochaete ingens]VVT53785.1 unnamed protein product [Saprochaete ingens]